jgi:adenylate cyclase class IV
MAKFKEIEVKWAAEQVDRDGFNDKLRAHLAAKEYLYRFVRVAGPDTYFSNDKGQTLRHRYGRHTHELTAKMRLYKRSIKARKEVNVKLSLKQPIEDVFELCSMLGLTKEIAIFKDCDIYFISGSQAHVSIVWYRVEVVGHEPKVFIEVEVEGLSHHKSLQVLKKWVKKIQTMYGLRRRDISDKSLYEIYTGKEYHKV